MVESVKREELAECLEVIHAGFGTAAEEFHLTVENCATNGAFMPMEKLIATFESDAELYVIRDNGKIAAFMELQKGREGEYSLEKLTTLPELRHKGYGAELIAFAAKRAAELGAERLMIGIIDENTRLKSWYVANGFEFLGAAEFPNLPFTVGFLQKKLK